MKDRTNRCLACDKMIMGTKASVCDECGGPEKIVLYCRSCRRRQNLSAKDLREFLRETDMARMVSPNVETGVTIAVDKCSDCLRTGRETNKMFVYEIHEKVTQH